MVAHNSANLAGRTFGKLRIVRRVGTSEKRQSTWEVFCDPELGGCGSVCTKPVRAFSPSHPIQSCGCGVTSATDLTGQRFSLLLVVERGGLGRFGGRHWRCRCDCGRECSVPTDRLRNGKTRSCGCLHRPPPVTTRHGHARRRGGRGGALLDSTYRAWASMKWRCDRDKEAHLYRDRGITVCPRWREDFAAFLADMGERPSTRHSVDRIDNDRGYEPGNCRWATVLEQARNTRRNVLLTHGGVTLCVAEWAERTGVHASTILRRIRCGVPVARALDTKRLRRSECVAPVGDAPSI